MNDSQKTEQRVETELVNRFLTWPVPADVYPDGTPGKPGRTGTNLLTADQARQMLAYVLGGPAPAEPAATEAAPVVLPWFPEFNIVVDICKFALRQQDSGVLEAASHQVERLLDALHERYQPRQHELLAKMWLQARDDIKTGRRATRLVPSAQADIPHGTTSKS